MWKSGCKEFKIKWHNANWKKYVLSGCTTARIYKIQRFMSPRASDQVEV